MLTLLLLAVLAGVLGVSHFLANAYPRVAGRVWDGATAIFVLVLAAVIAETLSLLLAGHSLQVLPL